MESMEKTLRNDLFFDGADMTIDALSSALRLQIAVLTQLSWLPHKKEGEACRKLVGKQHINWHRLLPHPLSGRAIYFLSSNCSDMILFVALVAHKAANDSRIIKFYGNVSLKGNLWSNDIYTNIHYVLKVTAVMNILEWAFDLDDAFATKCSSLFVYFRPHLFWLWSWQEYGRFPKVLRWARARKCLLFTKLGAWCRGHTTRLRQESHRTTSVCPTVHTLLEKISQWQSREQLLLMDLFYKPRQLTVPSRGQWENSLNSQVVRTFCGAWQSKNVTCYPICSYRGFVSHYFSAPGFSKYKQNRYLFSVYVSVYICTRWIKGVVVVGSLAFIMTSQLNVFRPSWPWAGSSLFYKWTRRFWNKPYIRKFNFGYLITTQAYLFIFLFFSGAQHVYCSGGGPKVVIKDLSLLCTQTLLASLRVMLNSTPYCCAQKAQLWTVRKPCRSGH